MNDVKYISNLMDFYDVLIFLKILDPHRRCHFVKLPRLRLKLLHEFVVFNTVNDSIDVPLGPMIWFFLQNLDDFLLLFVF